MERRFDRLRWGILLKILPLTAIFSLAKWGVHYLGWEPWEFDSLTGSLFGVATFVIAFVLSGTLSDYRTSEDIPAQIVNAVETIQDSNLLAAASHSEYNPSPLHQGLVQVLEDIQNWLKSDKPLDEVITTITDLNLLFAQLEKYSNAPMMVRVQGEQAKIRLLVTRMQLIRDTEFLAPASVLLELFLLGAITALLLIGADRFSENIVVSVFLFTSFIYLVALIRDLDNPFQYDGKSFVDVDLFPLEATLDRLQADLKLTQSEHKQNWCP
jgi:hypothetical protein